MNWYKTALTKLAMTHKEFFEFYALQGLSNEALKENPVMLFRLIEIVNEIREYYLDYLLKTIAKELRHAKPLISNLGSRHFLSNQTEEHELDYLERVRTILEKSPLQVNKEMQDYVLRVYNLPVWEGGYGGVLWFRISSWTFKLLNIGVIEQGYYNEVLLQKLREAIHIIDVINSLEHNTTLVLVDLPQKEHQWLGVALDTVFKSPDPVYLADLSGNAGLSELYRTEILSLEQKREFATDIQGTEDILKFFSYYFSVSKSDDKYKTEILNVINKIQNTFALYYILFKGGFISNFIAFDLSSLNVGHQFLKHLFAHSGAIVNYILKYQDVFAACKFLGLKNTLIFPIPKEEELKKMVLSKGSISNILDLKKDIYPDIEIGHDILSRASAQFLLDALSICKDIQERGISHSVAYNEELCADVRKMLERGEIERKILDEDALFLIEYLLNFTSDLYYIREIQSRIIALQNPELAFLLAKTHYDNRCIDISALQQIVQKFGTIEQLNGFYNIPGANRVALQGAIKDLNRDSLKRSE